MKLTIKNTHKKKVKVFDMHGANILGVLSFDTKTGITELMLLGETQTEKGETIARVIRSKKNTRMGSFLERKDGTFEINSKT